MAPPLVLWVVSWAWFLVWFLLQQAPEDVVLVWGSVVVGVTHTQTQSQTHTQTLHLVLRRWEVREEVQGEKREVFR